MNRPDELKDVLDKLRKEYNRKASSVISHTRGHLGELMTTMLYPRSERNNVIIDKMVFPTPYGNRRIDNYHEALKIAIESKNTRVTSNKFVRKQIKKDKYLLEQKLCAKVVWVMFRGASKSILKLLEEANISYYDLYDKYYEEVLRNEPEDSDLEIIEV